MYDIYIQNIIFVIGSCFVLLVCAGIAIIPVVMMEKSRRLIWEAFFQAPLNTVKIVTNEYNERFSLITGENLQLEAHEEEAQELLEIDHKDTNKNKKEKEDDTNKKHVDSSEGSEKSGGSKKAESEEVDEKKKYKVLPYDAKKRKIISCKMSIFFIVTVIYFYLIFFTGFESLEKILREMPDQVNLSSRRKQLVKGINQWMTESLINSDKDIGYKYINPTHQFVGSPILHTEEQIEELEFVENTVIYGNENHDISLNEYRSSDHEKLIFENACVAEVERSRED